LTQLSLLVTTLVFARLSTGGLRLVGCLVRLGCLRMVALSSLPLLRLPLLWLTLLFRWRSLLTLWGRLNIRLCRAKKKFPLMT
jgi:hypothetical protein